MADIAEIGFAADTSGLRSANAELGKLPSNAGKAESSADKLVRTMLRLTQAMESNVGKVARGRNANDNLTKSYTRLESAVQGINRVTGVASSSASSLGASHSALAAEADRLRKRYAPLATVIEQHNRNVTEIHKAYQSGILSSTEFAQALNREKDAFKKVSEAIASHNAALSGVGVTYQSISESINSANGVTKASATELGASYSALADEADRLRSKYAPLATATEEHNNNIAEIHRAYQSGILSSSEFANALNREKAAFASINASISTTSTKYESLSETINRVNGTTKASASSLGASHSALAAEADRLRARFAPLATVVSQYRKDLVELRRAYKLGVISAQEFSDALTRQRNAAEVARKSIHDSDQALARITKGAGLARHNVGNLAAQFQDIGVTAAAGMNPLTVALQQGTQISAVLALEAKSAGGALKFLGAAAKSVISPMALGTIAAVAIVVALVQLVDWGKVASDVLNTIADILPNVALFGGLAAAGLALLYAPTILRGAAQLPSLVLGLAKNLWGVAAALYATVGLPVLLVAGFVAIVAAANIFRDDLTKMLGFDIVGAAKKGLNFIIGSFVGAFKAIKQNWLNLPLLILSVTRDIENIIIRSITALATLMIAKFNKIRAKFGKDPIELNFKLNERENPFKTILQESGVSDIIGEAQGKDYVGGLVKGIKSGANKVSDKLRGIAGGIGKDKDGDKTDKFGKIVSGAQSQNASVRAEIEGLNLTASAARNLKNETDLVNKARNAGIKLTPVQTEKLKGLAAELTSLQDKLASDKFIKDFNKATAANTAALEAERNAFGLVGLELEKHKARTELLASIKSSDVALTDGQTNALLKQADAVAALRSQNEINASFTTQSNSLSEELLNAQTEIQALGLTKEAAAALRFERKLLNDEMFRGIALSPQQAAALKSEAAALSQTQTQLSKVQERLSFARDTTKGFFTQLQSGLVKGQNVFKTFANSVIGALNKIADKLLSSAFDSLLNGIFGGLSGGGGGGFLGGLLGFKKGGSFDGGVQKFAKGGSFTNSIVDSPTLFKFAKGTGMMGEAGPEAIMPLKRGADGSLGVQMHGGGQPQGGGSLSITNVNNFNGVTREEVMSDVKKSQDDMKIQIDNEFPSKIEKHNFDKNRFREGG